MKPAYYYVEVYVKTNGTIDEQILKERIQQELKKVTYIKKLSVFDPEQVSAEDHLVKGW